MTFHKICKLCLRWTELNKDYLNLLWILTVGLPSDTEKTRYVSSVGTYMEIQHDALVSAKQSESSHHVNREKAQCFQNESPIKPHQDNAQSH